MVAVLNIVIVEDHRALRESLLDVLTAEGHKVTAFENAEALWRGRGIGLIDIVVLDLNLPGEDGIAVARQLRAEHPDIGIVMLTARDLPDERRIGYESGADIYLAKPSSVPELTSSVEALARRLKPRRPEPTLLALETGTLELSGPAGTVALSAFEADLLAEFVRAPHNRLETNRIASMTGRDGEVTKAAIEVRIVRLRKKMIAAGAPGQPINVIRNHGYQMSLRIDIR